MSIIPFELLGAMLTSDDSWIIFRIRSGNVPHKFVFGVQLANGVKKINEIRLMCLL